jgi:PKD repeat protein
MKQLMRTSVLCMLLLPKIIFAQLCDTKYDYLKLRKEAQFNITSKLRGEIFNLKYIWDFGDGSNPITSNLNHVKKQFANPGKYKVCVKDELCSDSTNIFCDSIEITNDTPIVADFSYRQDVEGEITFFNKSTSKSPIGKIIWGIYNQETITGESDSLVHYLKNTGNISVCVYVFDEQKNYDSKCSTILIPPMSLCYPEFNYRIINGTYNFYNLSEFPTFSAEYLWDFGDGTTSTEREPKHDYLKGGNYNVSLTINGYCNRKLTKKLIVLDPPICKLKVTATVINQKALIKISDTANSSNNYYFVEFGDGEHRLTNDKIMEHIYPNKGSYTIKVSNTHSLCGELYGNTDVNIINTIPICKASFTAMADDITNNIVLLNNESQIFSNGNNSSYTNINWGDGTFETDNSNNVNFQHTYNSEGIYTIRVIVSNQINCADTSYQVIGVGAVYQVSGNIKQGENAVRDLYVNAFMFDPKTEMLSKAAVANIDHLGNYTMLLRRGNYIFQSDFAFTPSKNAVYLPTYYGDKLNWKNSEIITINGPKKDININQIPFTPINQNGGKIGGRAFYGNNVKQDGKLMTIGYPVGEMLVFLLDSNGKHVAYAHTSSASGSFMFNNTGAGSFTVWAEMPGKITIPVYVTLQNNNYTAENIKIIIGQNTVSSITESTLEIKQLSIDIYPNPATGTLTVKLGSTNTEIANIEIMDMLGNNLNIPYVSNSSYATLDVSTLKDGIYLISVSNQNGDKLVKKLVKSSN